MQKRNEYYGVSKKVVTERSPIRAFTMERSGCSRSPKYALDISSRKEHKKLRRGSSWLTNKQEVSKYVGENW